MDKEIFFRVWEIYQQHWGRENTYLRVASQGQQQLRKILEKNQSWFYTLRFVHSVLVNHPELKKADTFCSLQTLSEILMGMDVGIKKKTRFHTTIPPWNSLLYPELINDPKAVRNVLAIIAL